MPQANQVWICGKIGTEPNGKWSCININEQIQIRFGKHKLESLQIFGIFSSSLVEQIVNVLFHQQCSTRVVGLTRDFVHSLPSKWVIYQTPSGYMNNNAWFKEIDQFSKLLGTFKDNPYYLFLWTWFILGCRCAQPFRLIWYFFVFSTNSELSYNQQKEEWDEKYGTKKLCKHISTW